ncbi:MAG TPA: hypothetical protein VK360_07780 [Acidimicrobiales bacterium]|nr:hypothetical protein [Acidimicrobiales bacterium]
MDQPPLNALLQSALDCGDDRELRTALAADALEIQRRCVRRYRSYTA